MTQLLSEQQAEGLAKEVYGDIRKTFGMVPNLFKAMAAADPHWLAQNWQREKTIMIEDGPLDRKTRELIAMTVSIVNHCEYCTYAHEAMARQLGASKAEINHAKRVIELFSSFNAIVNAYPDLPCDIKPKD
ncbi:MAG: alkylhydroperoxidase [Gammaproteobacteria bacterium HGW-Gammaproteobacteria-3]|nr:MAG: alkylhydroperoxidase [Gammaproteobacteria bacterium HGW-Gammaproteobacteria-3]